MVGVISTLVGYAGGEQLNPTYKSIKDHTEVIRVEFDPKVVTYADILTSFLDQHSPFDRAYSRQYRSAILYHNEEQRQIASDVLQQLSARRGGRKIYTDVEPATTFYRAEEYHQKYVEKQNSRGGRSRGW